MASWFVPGTCITGPAKLLNKGMKGRPIKLSFDKFQSLPESGMSCCDMVMLALKYPESEVIGVRNIDSRVKEEESVG